jgi:hypothetical protein
VLTQLSANLFALLDANHGKERAIFFVITASLTAINAFVAVL